jgi:hypothetical protein
MKSISFNFFELADNGWAMKRSVQKDADLSDYTRAEFLNFLFIFFSKKAKFKNLATLQTHPNLSESL